VTERDFAGGGLPAGDLAPRRCGFGQCDQDRQGFLGVWDHSAVDLEKTHVTGDAVSRLGGATPQR
jgi:hypothetical protein